MRPMIPSLALLALMSPVLMQGASASDPLPLSQILTKVEADGARTVYSAERDRRGWEVISCTGNNNRDCVEDIIDATTGEVRFRERESVFRLPPEGSLPASQIATLVEEMKLGDIRDMEFDNRRWEVDVRNGGSRAELRLDPETGEVSNCRGSLC